MLDIDVYGGIGDEFDEGGVTAVSFVRALRDADGEDVTIHINSSGGSVFDANTMAEALRGYKGHTTASIEGLPLLLRLISPSPQTMLLSTPPPS